MWSGPCRPACSGSDDGCGPGSYAFSRAAPKIVPGRFYYVAVAPFDITKPPPALKLSVTAGAAGRERADQETPPPEKAEALERQRAAEETAGAAAGVEEVQAAAPAEAEAADPAPAPAAALD